MIEETRLKWRSARQRGGVGLVFNPAAGGGRGEEAAKEAARILRRREFSVVEAPIPAPGRGAEVATALASKVDVIAAVGGDGTVNEVVNGLPAEAAPALAVIPCGTANVLALEFGIPSSVEAASAVIAEGHSRIIDLAVARNGGGSRRFVLVAGVGIDAETVRDLDSDLKRHWKRAAFVLTGLKTFYRNSPPQLSVEVDGNMAEANFVVVGNCRYYGGRFGITSRAVPDDGLLDIVSLVGRGFPSNALFWVGLPLGLHLRHPGARYVRGRRVAVSHHDGERDVWFHTDAEVAGRIPVTFEIREHALRIVVPCWNQMRTSVSKRGNGGSVGVGRHEERKDGRRAREPGEPLSGPAKRQDELGRAPGARASAGGIAADSARAVTRWVRRFGRR